MSPHSGLGSLLRSHRQAAGLTLEELAASTGVSARAISDMERGHSKGPQSRTINALADSFDLSPAQRVELLAVAGAGRERASNGTPEQTLPADDHNFVGRQPELEAIAAGLTQDRAARTMVISGTGGLGKTALAVRAARQLAGDFTDGVLFLALRGLDENPVEPVQAATRLLAALGVRARDIPADADSCTSLLQRTLHSRRVLVVLDNAADETQVRALLPGGGPAAVIITSRRSLSGIDAGARIALSPLTQQDSIIMLAHILGPPPVTGHIRLDELAGVCGRFPLALRIAANRLLSRPGWTVQTIIERLSDQEQRLDRMTAGDLSIQNAFTLSYAQLNPPGKLVFRRMGLVQGPDWSLEAAAVLADLVPREVDLQLDDLVELGLLNVSGDQRYSFHDLVRLFARRRMTEEEPAGAAAIANNRHQRWLLTTAQQAGQFFEPSPPAATAAAPTLAPFLNSTDAAEKWLNIEKENWVAALRATAADGDHATVIEVVESMHWFSDRNIYLGVWLEVFEAGRQAALQLGDLRLQAVHTNYVSWVHRFILNNPTSALKLADEAFALALSAGDLIQQAWAKTYSASAGQPLGLFQRSLVNASEAAVLFDTAGDLTGYPQALLMAAVSALSLGRHSDVETRTQAILGFYDGAEGSIPDTIADFGRLSVWDIAARGRVGSGQYGPAEEYFQLALAASRRMALSHREAATLFHYAEMLIQCRRFVEAREALQCSHNLAVSINDDLRAAAVGELLDELVTTQGALRSDGVRGGGSA